MKKLLQFISILLLGAMLFTGCSKMLAEKPTSFMSPENSFDTPEQARTVLDGVYGSLQERGWGAGIYAHQLLEQIATDVTKCFATTTVEGLGDLSFTSNNSRITTYWQYSYELINRANLFIDNIEKTGFKEDTKESYKAEALFLRSLIYFNLVRLFGAVPLLVTPPKSLAPEEIYPSRTPPAEIYSRIIADLEFCETHLPEKGGSFGSENYKYGRATVGAVQGLLAQIYLYRGSMELRDGAGDGKALFTKSAEYARKVIQSAKYALAPYYPDIFREQGNSEVIFDIHYKSGVGIHPNAEGSQMALYLGVSGNVAAGGAYSFPLTTYYATYYYGDGDSIRKNWSVLHGKLAQRSNGQWFVEIATTNMQRGWGPGKWRQFPLRTAYTGTGDYGVNIPIMRLGEMYLILAEAVNEVNHGPNDEVINAANQLRTRACNVNTAGSGNIHDDVIPRVLKAMPANVPLLNKNDFDYNSFKEYLFYERARELSMEWTRYYDLQRWGKLIEAIQLVGNTINTKTNNKVEPDYWALNNINPRHYLMPIPAAELGRNPNLTQNPGY